MSFHVRLRGLFRDPPREASRPASAFGMAPERAVYTARTVCGPGVFCADSFVRFLMVPSPCVVFKTWHRCCLSTGKAFASHAHAAHHTGDAPFVDYMEQA